MKAVLEKNKIERETILEKLNWRYAVKKFDPAKKISESDWEILEDALDLAPSSMGLQAYKFIVVTDQETKEKLKPAAYGQTQITDASHVVVFAYKKTLTGADIDQYIERVAKVREQTRESLEAFENSLKSAVSQAIEGGYIETWNSRQPYIALGMLLETAALMDIDATPMEGFDAAKVNEILSLNDYSAVAICALGYRDVENDWLVSLPKVRMPKDELIQRI
jgi:nitroreductase